MRAGRRRAGVTLKILVGVFAVVVAVLVRCASVPPATEPLLAGFIGEWLSEEAEAPGQCSGTGKLNPGRHIWRFDRAVAVIAFHQDSGGFCGDVFDWWDVDNDSIRLFHDNVNTRKIAFAYVLDEEGGLLVDIDDRPVRFMRQD